MNTSQCTARLLASAVHDMRNVLAVIRESAGLAQDLAEQQPVAKRNNVRTVYVARAMEPTFQQRQHTCAAQVFRPN